MSQQEDPNRMLRDAVTAFAARDTSIARVRQLRDSAPGFDKAVWKTIAELGWTGIMIPEEYGGMGLGLGEMAAVLEEFAKTLSPEPLNPSSVLAAAALLHGDNEALKKKLLPGIASGEILPALAWQEAEGGIDPLAIATRAEGGALNGGKRFVFPAMPTAIWSRPEAATAPRCTGWRREPPASRGIRTARRRHPLRPH